MANPKLSVIIPFKNEAESLPRLHAELCETLSKISDQTEVIYIDDGSTDNSSISTSSHPNITVKLIRFWRNTGQTAATSAGIDNSHGDLVAFLDADGQNPPSDLLPMFNLIDANTDAVFGWRKNRHDDLIRVVVSKIANWLIRIIFHVTIKDLGCSIRIVRRDLLANMRLYGENHRLLSLLIVLRGAKYKEIAVNHRPRAHGKSKYGYSRSVKTIIDIITTKFLDSYSTKPAYIFGTGGLVSLALSVPAFAQVVYRKIWLGIYVHNNPMFIIAMFLVFIGVSFILLGLMSELMVRVYFESRQKPIYEIKEVKNL
ncbi:MAG: Undecaprenyl phosphate 4-deoxy-4-formamido-L-arabinose transferase [Microgenomates group bacterium Gr01-1014_16]|nr:MAG: Undecaprenyl phosphate 4-deoxy-4-formamido-L-arabinose transferase [Microgenomates group bacterium Gr01-1014_16]